MHTRHTYMYVHMYISVFIKMIRSAFYKNFLCIQYLYVRTLTFCMNVWLLLWEIVCAYIYAHGQVYTHIHVYVCVLQIDTPHYLCILILVNFVFLQSPTFLTIENSQSSVVGMADIQCFLWYFGQYCWGFVWDIASWQLRQSPELSYTALADKRTCWQKRVNPC